MSLKYEPSSDNNSIAHLELTVSDRLGSPYNIFRAETPEKQGK